MRRRVHSNGASHKASRLFRGIRKQADLIAGTDHFFSQPYPDTRTLLLSAVVELLAKIHSYLLRFNDAYEYNFSDKELHFLVIGILGMMFIFVVYPVFKWLAKHDHVMVIAWIYVFTLIIVITFAIEIGQKVTNTGNMEFADIVFGVVGFIVMFFIFAVIREIYKGIVSLIRDVAHQDQNRSKKRHQRAYDEYEEDVMDEDDEE